MFNSILEYFKNINIFKNNNTDSEKSKNKINYNYFISWIIGIILLTLLFLILNMLNNYIGHNNIGNFKINSNIRALTPAYPPPLTNFIDSNDFLNL
jgi:large-conductance mechanosensitive channel